MEVHGTYEAGVDVIQGEITNLSGWGLPNDAERDGWTSESYLYSLERSSLILEKAPAIVASLVESERDFQEEGVPFQDFSEIVNELAELFGLAPIRFMHLVDEDA